MKVLFVGEGSDDIGRAEFATRPRPAAGAVPTLAKRVVPEIGNDSLAIPWQHITRFSKDRDKATGYAAKVRAAVKIAEMYGCEATVCVPDRDRDPRRIEQLIRGAEESRSESHPIVTGIAIESVEAWTLGARTALKEMLGVSDTELDQLYRASRVERYYNNSGDATKRAKRILERVAALANRSASSEFREEVAELTDPQELERSCPEGFAPFAVALRSELSTSESTD